MVIEVFLGIDSPPAFILSTVNLGIISAIGPLILKVSFTKA